MANRDVNLWSGVNTSVLDGSNESHGSSVGVGLNFGQGSSGLTINASANKGKGSESGNGLTHTETTVSAGNNLTIVSGRDTTLTGAQVSGDKVTMDVGRNLTLTSEQDSDNYDSKQQNASAGVSGGLGSFSASANLSQDKMHSTYESVIEQTGVFAGKGGFDITVGEHTQLNGAVIGSTAEASKNQLDTGTLGFSDLENKAEYEVEHLSVGLSTSGSIGDQFLGNMANSLLVGVNGSIIIRDKDNQTQNVADLSRDVEHANQTLSPIFDKEKEQQRLQEAQKIGEIGSQVMDIARTQGDINGLTAAKKELGPLKENATEKERQAYVDALRNTSAYKDEMKKYGTGSAIQQGLQAATAAIQGLAGGDMAKAIAGGAAPYLAEVIHNMTTNPVTGEVNKEANLMAHAVVGAVVAQINGNSALAGASGAAMGEFIAQQLYPDIKREDLTEEQRQTISALGTMAAGLAGGLTGGSSADAVAGAQAGKNAVENNAMRVLAAAEKEKPGTIAQFEADKRAEIAEACSGGTPVSCQTMTAAMGTGLALPLLPASALTAGTIGATANAGISYGLNGTVDPNDVLFAFWTGAFTANTGFVATVGWNATSGAASSYVKGDDPLTGGAISGIGSGLGYGFGKLVEIPIGKVLNPNWKNWEWTDVGMGVSKPLPVSPLPGMAGNAGASGVTEVLNDQAGKEVKKIKVEANDN